jgi:hypothetical protein
MARYILKPSTESVFFIRYQGKNIGEVRRRAVGNEWIARIGSLVKYASTAQQAFYDIVASRNRIDLCGEDDPVKARAALDKRNAEIERRNAQAERDFAPLLETIEKLGLPYPRPRRRSRRIRI